MNSSRTKKRILTFAADVDSLDLPVRGGDAQLQTVAARIRRRAGHDRLRSLKCSECKRHRGRPADHSGQPRSGVRICGRCQRSVLDREQARRAATEQTPVPLLPPAAAMVHKQLIEHGHPTLVRPLAFRLVLPSRTSTGEPVSPVVRERVLHKLGSVYGGATVYAASGLWFDGAALHGEDVFDALVFTDFDTFTSNVEVLLDTITALLADAGQASVAVIIDAHMIEVRPQLAPMPGARRNPMRRARAARRRGAHLDRGARRDRTPKRSA